MRFINMLLYRINKFFGAPLVLVAFLFICKGMTGMDLFAADPVASSSPGSDGPQDNLRFLFAVFFITWLAFFAYIFFLSKRLAEMKREVEELRRSIVVNSQK